jgi:hypothetical protein
MVLIAAGATSTGGITAFATKKLRRTSRNNPHQRRLVMTTSNVESLRNIEYPRIAFRAEWLAARKELLAKEKELTRHRDAVNAERRRLPMVRIEKDYVFESPASKARLLDLFGERRQLIVYHFMFDPS